ncbi:MAG: hypothetical protein OES84_01375 [Kiritimatiellaceae bacterium]|nr:hypothetical protein [Kiritimatiellaceae bacterium]
MKLPIFGEINSERFLTEAINGAHSDKLIKHARIRRNVYLWMFVASFLCIPCTALFGQMTLCICSLFFATISLVVMTKYDTQLFFLQLLKNRKEKDLTPDHS